ncbi:MAG: helix-turn-helix domain-containing protein [Fuerstiella sp.]|nr:helix-turn-helix domain-containing protein [Fuerstiella sp.]
MDEGLLYTDGELADLLKVSRSTVRRMWFRQELPAPLKIGAVIRWRQSEIRQWLVEHQTHTLYDDSTSRIF